MLRSCSHVASDVARQCGRRAIAIEQDRHWWHKGRQRLSQGDLFTAPVATTTWQPPQQLTLTGGTP